jgi:hypothetical protein
MSEKPINIGRGRLYFGDRLLGTTGPATEQDDLSLMQPRKTTFSATARIDMPNYSRWLRNAYFMGLVGYNPQRLLGDQRSAEKKRADDLVAKYRKSFPDMATHWGFLTRDLFADSAERLRSWYGPGIGETYEPTGEFEKAPIPKWHDGGTVTGRLGSRLETHWPVMRPRDEHVVPKDHPLLDIDYGKLEERAMAHYVKPITVDVSRFVEGLERATQATRRAAKSILAMSARLNEHAQRQWDRRILIELFGHVDLDKPEPQFDRERRIAKLLKSRDPRQKKRGERLFLSYRRSSPGINYRKD